MPSFFGKHIKTARAVAATPNPAPQSPDGDDAAAAPTSATAPESEESTSAAALSSSSSTTGPPEGTIETHDKDEDLDGTKEISGAFEAVRSAEPAVQKYEGSRSRKVLDKTGEQGLSEYCDSPRCS